MIQFVNIYSFYLSCYSEMFVNFQTADGEMLHYEATTAYAYLPASRLGNQVFEAMKKAFERRMLFQLEKTARSTARLIFTVEMKRDPAGR